jgi:SpoVK/Ycf46/Vps4 family AAA+-type ATPase
MAEQALDLSLQYLQVELAQIDLLIRYEVRRWQMAGQDPDDKFRGLYLSDEGADALLDRPFATSWGQTVRLPEEVTTAFAEAQAQLIERRKVLRAEAHRQGQMLRLDHLTHSFGLTQFETDTFLVCLAPHLDLRYERIFGYLQDDVTRKRPTVNLVLDLLCPPGPGRLLMYRYFAETAPLFQHHLLMPLDAGEQDGRALLSQPLSPDRTVVAWLLGDYQPQGALTEHTTVSVMGAAQNGAAQSSALIPEDTRVLALAQEAERPLLILQGPDQTRARAVARHFAQEMGRALLMVNLAGVIGEGTPPLHALRLALRDARMIGAVPCLLGWDAVLEEGTTPPSLFLELRDFRDVAVIVGERSWQPKGIDRDFHLFWLEFPIPGYPQRLALWHNYLARGDVALDGLEITELAGQFLLTTGQIRDAVSSARDAAAQENRAVATRDLYAAARVHSHPSLAGLARKITPRYTWDDIVLPDDQFDILHEIVNTVRGRPTVMEAWGVGHKLASSNGVTMLFAGPPGTGKTMAAEVIAQDLGLDLYKIDLSTVVSKYIGETEKNLERIFTEAQSSNAILFFDEADAIFGKRSEVKDAHDRYANLEIAYLLQRMEAYDGVTMLATNLRANLDEAFTRRLQFAVNFPFPEEDYRLRIWRTLFPQDVPRTDDINFELLAQRFKLTGGNIRNIIIAAAFLAAAEDAPVAMRHLFHATRRELQKMGRLLNERDLRI